MKILVYKTSYYKNYKDPYKVLEISNLNDLVGLLTQEGQDIILKKPKINSLSYLFLGESNDIDLEVEIYDDYRE